MCIPPMCTNLSWYLFLFIIMPILTYLFACAHSVFNRGSYHICHSLATFDSRAFFIICHIFNYVEHQSTLLLWIGFHLKFCHSFLSSGSSVFHFRFFVIVEGNSQKTLSHEPLFLGRFAIFRIKFLALRTVSTGSFYEMTTWYFHVDTIKL